MGSPVVLTWIVPVFNLCKGYQAKHKAGFRFNVQKWPVPDCDGASLVKKPHFDTMPDICQGGRKSAVGTSTSTADLWEKGSHRVSHS